MNGYLVKEGITYVRGELIVSLKTPADLGPFQTFLNSKGYQFVFIADQDSLEVTVQTNTVNFYDLISAETQIKAQPGVRRTRLNISYSLNSIEPAVDAVWKDTDSARTWNFSSIKWQQALAAMPALSDIPTIEIGVVDASYVFSHPDLIINHIQTGYPRTNLASVDHGTHVLGIIGASWNADGLAGVSPKLNLNAAVMNLDEKTFGSYEARLTSKGVRVINFSLGDKHIVESVPYKTIPQCDEWTETVEKAVVKVNTDQLAGVMEFIDKFPAQGQQKPLLVQGAGNDGNCHWGQKADDSSSATGEFIYSEYNSVFSGFWDKPERTPENEALLANIQDYILLVGAYYVSSDGNRHVSEYSSKLRPNARAHDHIIYAPGGSVLHNSLVWSTVSHASGDYKGLQGTSMAAPHVTGVAALILQANSNLSASELKNIILSTADNIDGSPWQEGDGFKFLNAEAGVKEAIRRKAEANCGTISAPVSTPVSLASITAGRPYNYTVATTSSPKNNKSFGTYLWTSSQGFTGTAFLAPDMAITLPNPTTPPEVATIYVTPVLDDGTVCSSATTHSTVLVVAAPTPAVGLIGKYTFDDCTASDSSGLGRNGLLTGTVCVPGRHGSALEFRNPSNNVFGGSHWVEFPPHTTNAVTFSAWVNWAGSTNGILTETSAIWSLGTHPTDSFMSIWVTEGLATIWTDNYTQNPYRMTPGTWTMLTITSDGTSESLYMDGVLLSTYSHVAAAGFVGKVSYLSRHFWAGGSHAARFRGVMDDVFVYDRALTPSEIQSLYMATK
ncbi:MAG: S8 family serine peptidase [Burkholderiales bacterium]|nr:S8 family serine peptidase [Burkholderiales bacterium]